MVRGVHYRLSACSMAPQDIYFSGILISLLCFPQLQEPSYHMSTWVRGYLLFRNYSLKRHGDSSYLQILLQEFSTAARAVNICLQNFSLF